MIVITLTLFSLAITVFGLLQSMVGIFKVGLPTGFFFSLIFLVCIFQQLLLYYQQEPENHPIHQPQNKKI
jgi:hypothetical protein